jgi:pimeloyl-CoA synthetase
MKKNEIKRTVEEVVRVEYITEDGQVFYDEAEAQKYEESALFAVSNKLKRLNGVHSIYDLIEEGSEECDLEIFDVKTDKDLENLKRYLYLKLAKNGAGEKTINSIFTADSESRKDFVFDNVTIGHEVLVFWGYDNDWCWTYKDGSLEGYFSWLRDQYAKITTPKEKN